MKVLITIGPYTISKAGDNLYKVDGHPYFSLYQALWAVYKTLCWSNNPDEQPERQALCDLFREWDPSPPFLDQ